MLFTAFYLYQSPSFRMPPTWLILADDLTGAADCAVPFAKRGLRSALVWGDRSVIGEAPCLLSCDLQCRSMPASIAASRHRDALEQRWSSQTRLFKKIDSTLRGHPAAEIAAVMQSVRARTGSAFGIFAPAFPAMGRTTSNGRIHVDGEPLEMALLGRCDRTDSKADLLDMLSAADVPAVRVSLDAIRGESDALRSMLAKLAARGNIVAVCDAVIQDDLDRIAAASFPASDAAFFIGSAGLAHAIAALVAGTQRPAVAITPSTQGTLVVVGSLASPSKAAAHRFAAQPNVRYVAVEPKRWMQASRGADHEALGREAIDGLNQGDVLVQLIGDDPDRASGSKPAAKLAVGLKPAAAHMSGLVATGGETAMTLLDAFGVDGIELIDEIEPGISLGLTRGALSLPIVTKSGAFGDADCLIRIAARLRHIRQIGIVA